MNVLERLEQRLSVQPYYGSAIRITAAATPILFSLTNSVVYGLDGLRKWELLEGT